MPVNRHTPIPDSYNNLRLRKNNHNKHNNQSIIFTIKEHPYLETKYRPVVLRRIVRGHGYAWTCLWWPDVSAWARAAVVNKSLGKCNFGMTKTNRNHQNQDAILDGSVDSTTTYLHILRERDLGKTFLGDIVQTTAPHRVVDT